MKTDLNQLEPQALVDAFLKYPPAGFQVHEPDNFLAFFYTRFNLLTTLDVALHQKIKALPGYRHWQNMLHLQTCFVGTTVTEYTLLSAQLSAQQMTEFLKQHIQKTRLTIIKDLPLNSPFISEMENNYSQELIKSAEKNGFLSVEGQALAYVPIDFENREDYLSRLSKSRRKNLKRKLKSLNEIDVEILATGHAKFQDAEFTAQLYRLYLNVYHQSEIHFDLLSPAFFQAILQDGDSGGTVLFYWVGTALAGFNLCYEYRGNLVDKYIGFNYPLATDHNLYFISWFVNLEYARVRGMKFYIAGWTDPEVKAQLGAEFTFTRHLVWIRSPVLRFILTRLRSVFEADHHWHQQQELKS
ncbi:GNAT family N-acetyltransferase [Acinetobacter sp. WZC-1]|uniref:GNAT family N-acetyltransferase n=1 Tax=Acinetobacter sp. WZC-1 TaxID=3459034 RepID=UPI00403DA894